MRACVRAQTQKRKRGRCYFLEYSSVCVCVCRLWAYHMRVCVFFYLFFYFFLSYWRARERQCVSATSVLIQRKGSAIDVHVNAHLEVLKDVHDGVAEMHAFERRGKLDAVERLLRPDVVLCQPRSLL